MTHPETLPDQLMEQISRSLAGRSTRRSFFGKASRIAFGILGFELLPASPVDARPLAPQAPAPAWQKCGAYGQLSQTDCTLPSDYSRPSYCPKGSSMWTACCCESVGNCQFIEYYDCFTSSDQWTCTKTIGTKGLQCLNITEGQTKPTYGAPPSQRRYCCSIIYLTNIPCTDP